MEDYPDVTVRRGTVIFLDSFAGSKSQSVLPYLYESVDSCVRIMLKGDNPFENAGLCPYDGKMVEIRCVKGRGNVFIAQDIVVLAPVEPKASGDSGASE